MNGDVTYEAADSSSELVTAGPQGVLLSVTELIFYSGSGSFSFH